MAKPQMWTWTIHPVRAIVQPGCWRGTELGTFVMPLYLDDSASCQSGNHHTHEKPLRTHQRQEIHKNPPFPGWRSHGFTGRLLLRACEGVSCPDVGVPKAVWKELWWFGSAGGVECVMEGLLLMTESDLKSMCCHDVECDLRYTIPLSLLQLGCCRNISCSSVSRILHMASVFHPERINEPVLKFPAPEAKEQSVETDDIQHCLRLSQYDVHHLKSNQIWKLQTWSWIRITSVEEDSMIFEVFFLYVFFFKCNVQCFLARSGPSEPFRLP